MAEEKRSAGLSKDEQEAVKDRAAETRAASSRKGAKGREKDRADVDKAIAAMTDDDRAIAQAIQDIVAEVAPDLDPKTYYGMPAYARDGKIVVFVQAAAKFKTRYSTLGFDQNANLDDGTMWPTAYAVTSIDDANRATIAKLVAQAAS